MIDELTRLSKHKHWESASINACALETQLAAGLSSVSSPLMGMHLVPMLLFPSFLLRMHVPRSRIAVADP